MQIQTTKDYSKFKLVVSNREVDKNHVKRLAESIRRKNLLFIRPLIVNDDMQVIDGQHRLAACELINEHVHYIKVAGLSKSDISILNTAQKNWSRIDFINFFAIEGKPEFKLLAKMINKYSDLKVSLVINLCCSDAKKLRQGIINISNADRAETVFKRIYEMKAKHRFVVEREFGLAFNSVIKSDDQYKAMLKYITPENFYKCGSRPEYERMLSKFKKVS